MGSSLQFMGTENHFLNITVVAQTVIKINKWELLKLRSFSRAKDTVNQTKR